MGKASIAAVVLALGIVSLVQEGTNATVALPAGLRPALTMPAVETVALRKSVTVTRAALQKAEIEKWWPILKAANIKGE